MEEVISFLTVLVVAVAIAGGIGTMYATGLRLWARSATAEQFYGLSYCFGCMLCSLCIGSAFRTLAYDPSVPLGPEKG